MESFVVRHAVVEELTDLNSFVVGLYEDKTPTGRYIELQRALSFDEQDRDAGMDTYCLATSTGASHYGGVRSCVLRDKVLEFGLDRSSRPPGDGSSVMTLG
jgi:hypothetical protein